MAEAVARWDFGGNGDDLLAFKTGDLIKLTALDAIIGISKWYRAYLNGSHGYVDGIMLEIKPFKWFWCGSIDKFEAEDLLLNSQTRKFLIRESAPASIDYYLSYKIHEDKVEHFKIHCNPDMTFYFFNDFRGRKSFNSLNELAIYVKEKGWYAAAWWTPYIDEESQLLLQKQKLVEWSPNE